MLFLALIALVSPFAFGSTNGDALNSCGLQGYDKGAHAYEYFESKSLATFAKCSKKCTADVDCESFAYGAGACLLYKTSVYVRMCHSFQCQTLL